MKPEIPEYVKDSRVNRNKTKPKPKSKSNSQWDYEKVKIPYKREKSNKRGHDDYLY